ncbi:5-formyltetrahydrofolate cyclo-ligase [Vitreoscilla massiliensis]|uniref:5-formyltetrahydrofolate cyclo-ligase n=1 Tax=Vitreoscilla massiliensis TaxID=1689272 RepID=A0ABY4E4H7_9NEIS|nr:5-formyltetrahydrofolate cyclo-ligase [Vitreoscilla massiliensis]UOO90669.1 5-formyltetrahydrofolate cyclo-ligase [Vitreoscilla massiliensis]
MHDKATLRRHLRRQRLNLTATERRSAQAQVCRLLKPLLRRGKNIGMYLASGSELNISAILPDAMRQGCQLYTPYIEPNQRRLWFTPYPAAPQHGHHVLNILQYEGKKRRLEQLDIVLMPLIGIDQRGMRLGQGGGFYDTSLSFGRAQQPLRIGIGFAVQQYDHIPNEAHDQALDAFVCENGITVFSTRARAWLAPYV